MIPVLVDAGHRCVAPDLVGFGRSDKPARRSDYSYAGHVAQIAELVRTLALQDIILVCQDWGGCSACASPRSTNGASIASWPPTPSCRPATLRSVRPSSHGASSRRRFRSSRRRASCKERR
ncbi:MAG: alpha/beta fold hydrolase [Candidatus Binatia bacterium]